MKATKILTILALAFVLMACLPSASKATSMGTAFTYQGHLYDNNDVANNFYDFQFKLYDSNSGSGQVGSDVNVPDVDVIEGYFTVELDFGSGVFDGNAVWLEIGVRPGIQNDPCAYTPLSPRQEVTPAPYAIYAKSAGSSSTAWTNSGIVWTAPYTLEGDFPSTLKYKKIENIVFLKGVGNAGATKVSEGQIICTLPDGFRPPVSTIIYIVCPTLGWHSGYPGGYIGTAGVTISPNGIITIKTVHNFNAQQQFIIFDSICFSTD